ncbi:paralemmin-1 [Platysternon megacephalum]|uniref:Paralemmin-1 n=1 Tax=Platysternon megacephalum TaxID=55544 RepID=A0A4D9EAM4_9SAUR|nr:paralemmin-1 [Platysternon megacephalum]
MPIVSNTPHTSLQRRFADPQAELYQAVLEIQKSCLSLCSQGVSLENIYSLMLSLMGQKLKELGILKKSTTENHLFKAFISPRMTCHPREVLQSQCIEDDMVVTEDVSLILSAYCPKEICRVEQICGRSL